MRDIKLRSRLSKNVLLSRDCIRKSSVQINSRLDSHSNFQMFTLFSGGLSNTPTNLCRALYCIIST